MTYFYSVGTELESVVFEGLKLAFSIGRGFVLAVSVDSR